MIQFFQNRGFVFKTAALLVLTLVALLFSIAFTLVFTILIFGKGSVQDDPDAMLFIQGLVSVGMFVIPAVLFAYFFKTEDDGKIAGFLMLDKKPKVSSLLICVAIGLCIIPFIAWIGEVNSAVELPESLKWLGDTDDSVSQTLEKMMKGPLVVQILVIAVLPALSEELYFRGVIQNRILGATNIKPWGCVLITGFIFSAIHFQFSGFLPRFLLGCMLGFMLVLTKSLWTPVVCHFINNLLAVMSGYFYDGDMNAVDEKIKDMPVLIVVSAVLTVALSVLLYKKENNYKQIN